MEIEKAMDILKRLKIATVTSSVDGYEVLEPLEMAIEALKKQVPTNPIIKPWEPARCPMCGEQLSESIGEGYYKHWESMKICNCGQKLKWD